MSYVLRNFKDDQEPAINAENLNYMDQAIKQAFDTRIVEHNLDVSNPENGYYIRWENGLQVCWHSEVRRFPIESISDNTFYYGQVIWHFPAVFLECRYAHMVVRTQPWIISSVLGSNVLPVEEYVLFFAISTRSIPEEDRQLGFIAIGRWK